MPREPPVTSARFPLREIMTVRKGRRPAGAACGGGGRAPARRSPPPGRCRATADSELRFDELAYEMLDAQVQLLRAVGARGRDDDAVVGEGAERAAVARAEGEDGDPAGPRRLRRAQHVRRLPARRVDDEQVAGARERLHLPGEDLL